MFSYTKTTIDQEKMKNKVDACSSTYKIYVNYYFL